MAGLDYSDGEHRRDLFLNFRFLEMGITVGADVNGCGVRQEVDVMLDIAGRW